MKIMMKSAWTLDSQIGYSQSLDRKQITGDDDWFDSAEERNENYDEKKEKKHEFGSSQSMERK